MNAIQKLQADTELTEIERMILEESQTEDAAFDFVAQRIKLPSGGNLYFDLEGEPVKEFTAVVALSQKARAWWPSKGTSKKPPLCSSSDAKTAWIQLEPDVEQLKEADQLERTHPATRYDLSDPSANHGPYECSRCPLSAYGSAPEGRGQACKELRRLVLLIDGYTMPVLMTLPPTSIKTWDRFCSGLQNRKSAYFAVKTKFTLTKATNSQGVDYATVELVATEKISDVETFGAVQEIRNQYRELIEGLPIDAAEYNTEGESIPF